MFKAGIFLALFALVKTGSCISCYHCTSQQDPACGDPFTYTKGPVPCESTDSKSFNSNYLRGVLPGEVLTETAGSPRYCHKFVTETGTVIRTCLDSNPEDLNKTCRILESTHVVVPTKMKYCSVCEKEKCNGAGSIAVSLPLATFALVATYLLLKQ
ncbi:hypothetical protein K1T71_009815 [Dendrolimus kikuchii]|uniref:Uncharacterized protein n=1 Tax=Dendrolimus kikuchii TaxID=765133 RepID=A0ACC1CSW7_9NEOP|nr:hypothetical protein K1T71_009815 [Dendrolimus kikuchii]